ncbi:hypothetical protein HK100_004937, partial [Physocladia obscura]
FHLAGVSLCEVNNGSIISIVISMEVNKILQSFKTAFLGIGYIPVIIYEDLLNQILHVAATKICLTFYILAAIAFYIPFTVFSPPTPAYVQAYLVCFVVAVFAPMVLGGIRVAFAHNAAGLRSDLVCPVKKPSLKAHHVMSVLGYAQEALELFAAGLKCALESGRPLVFMDARFVQAFGFFAGVTTDRRVFRAVFWICVGWVFVTRKYIAALNKKLGVANAFVVWWSPTVSYDCPFYILVCEVMISVFRCHGSDGGEQTLGELDPPVVCWTGEHLGLTVVAFATMIAYFPSGCSMCSAKDLITYEESDLRFVPAYVKFSQMVKGVCICGMVLFAQTPGVAFAVAITAMVVMFGVTLRFWPAASYGLNTVKMFTYAGSAYLYAFLLAALYLQNIGVVEAAVVITCGLVAVLVLAGAYEVFVVIKHQKATYEYLIQVIAAFSDSSVKQVVSADNLEKVPVYHDAVFTSDQVLRPVEVYTGFLLSNNPLQYRPAFLMLNEVQKRMPQMDSERQTMINLALLQLSERPRKHPAYEDAKQLTARKVQIETNENTAIAIKVFEKMITHTVIKSAEL